MPQKSKFLLEEKIKIVEDCINGKNSITGSAKQHGVNVETIRCWIRLYKARGIEGLIPSVGNKKYSVELKKSAVEEYLSGKVSMYDVCTKYDISRNAILQRWIKRYNSHGEFNQPNSGGKIYMTKGRNMTFEERAEIVCHCIASNKDYGKTVEKYNVSYQQVYTWVSKYEKHGTDGLIDRRGKRKEESAMTEVEKLQAQLKLKEAENLRLQMENDLLKKLEEIERGIEVN